MLSIDHDGELFYKGDNVSFANLAENADAQNIMKRILSEGLSESKTSYNLRAGLHRNGKLGIAKDDGKDWG